jgi:hypothetical protein
MQVWKPLLVTGLGVAVVAGFLILPRKAEAAPIEKMVQAIEQVRFWKATTLVRADGGQWGPYGTCTYRDGRLQFDNEVFGGSSRSIRTHVFDAHVYVDYSDQPYILKRDFKPNPNQTMDSMTVPLKRALRIVSGHEGELIRRDGLSYLGSAAYSLNFKNKANAFEAKIQSATNLPFEVLTTIVATNKKHVYEYKTTYSYEVPKNYFQLTPDARKTILDTNQIRTRLAAEWSKCLPFRPFQVSLCSDGSIWVARSVKDSASLRGVSWKILGGKYVECTNYFLKNFLAPQDAFFINGHEVAVVQFVPIYDLAKQPDSISIETNGLGTRTKHTQTYSLVHENWTFPSYLPVFADRIDPILSEVSTLSTVADARMKGRDFLSAARIYEQIAQTEGKHHITSSQPPLIQAAICYEKMGDHNKAESLRKAVASRKFFKPGRN